MRVTGTFRDCKNSVNRFGGALPEFYGDVVVKRTGGVVDLHASKKQAESAALKVCALFEGSGQRGVVFEHGAQFMVFAKNRVLLIRLRQDEERINNRSRGAGDGLRNLSQSRLTRFQA